MISPKALRVLRRVHRKNALRGVRALREVAALSVVLRQSVAGGSFQALIVRRGVAALSLLIREMAALRVVLPGVIKATTATTNPVVAGHP